MKTPNKTVAALLMTLLLSACGGGSGGSSAKTTDANQPDLSSPVQPVDPNAPTTESVTYYTKTITEAPVNGWAYNTVTSKGMCVLYDFKTYCWDDGAHLLPAWTFNHFTYGGSTYSFWRMAYRTFNGTVSFGCYGGGGTSSCSGDSAMEPVLMTSSVLYNVTVAKVNDVFATGVPKTVTCTKTGSTLNCVDFTVDLTQVLF